MSRSYNVPSAVAALVLTACAHGGASAVNHSPAARAAQPFGWPERLVSEPAGPVTIVAAPAGRAAQPYGWPTSLGGASSGPISEEPATLYAGGRAAQPFGWPERLVEQQEVASRAGAQQGRTVQ